MDIYKTRWQRVLQTSYRQPPVGQQLRRKQMEHLTDPWTGDPQTANKFAPKVPGPAGELQLGVGEFLLLPWSATTRWPWWGLRGWMEAEAHELQQRGHYCGEEGAGTGDREEASGGPATFHADWEAAGVTRCSPLRTHLFFVVFWISVLFHNRT